MQPQINKPKISIIVAIYNAEKYLHQCLDSIAQQTFPFWECILVDDGSTDSSSQICDNYAIQDSRFKVIHKKNEGVAIARKVGIENATGEYSIHTDSDDWIEPIMLESLYKTTQITDADIIITDYFVNKSNFNQKVSKQEPSSLTPKQILLDLLNNRLFGSLCNKLIRTNLYWKLNIRFFSDINHSEDLLTCIQLLQNSNLKISYLPKAFYHYRVNDSSITHHFTRDTYNMRIKFRDKLEELLNLPNSKEIIEEISFQIFTEAFIYNILTKEEIRNNIKLYKKQIRKIKSIKWKVGFLLLSQGFSNLAHKCIHY